MGRMEFGVVLDDDDIIQKDENWLIDDIVYRISHGKNTNLSVLGDTGSGKSYLCLRIGELSSKRLNVPFTIEQVLFDPIPFFKLIKTLPHGSVIMFDEGSVDAKEIIPYEFNGELQVEPIEKIYTKFNLNPSSIRILATDLKETKWIAPSAIIKHLILPHKKMYKIATSTEKVITGSSDHSFIVREKGIIKLVKGAELKIGMEVPVSDRN